MSGGSAGASPTGHSRWRWVRRFFRVAIPLAFVAVTAWTVVDLVSQGPPPRRFGSAAAEPDGPRVSIAVAADIGSDERARATLHEMAEADPDLHLMLGDLSYAGPESERPWCDLVRERLGLVVPVQVVAGNHEEDTGEDGFIDEFTECLPDRMISTGEYGRQYFFDVGSLARIILISPDLTIGGTHYYYGDGNANQVWLEQAIDGARAAGIRWVVVGTHKPCISVGEYYCLMYQDLFDVLIEKRVDLVISGHDHSYQRSRQIADGAGCPQVVVDTYDPDCVVDDGEDGEYRQGEGPVFLVAGMGGGELYDVNLEDPESGYFAAVSGRNENPRWGFVKLTMTDGLLSAEFVPSSGGRFQDGFSIAAD